MGLPDAADPGESMVCRSWMCLAKDAISAKSNAEMSHMIVFIVVLRDCSGGGTQMNRVEDWLFILDSSASNMSSCEISDFGYCSWIRFMAS